MNNVKTVADERNHTTTYDYDQRSRVVRATGPTITGPAAPVTRTSYDGANNLLQTTDPTGAGNK